MTVPGDDSWIEHWLSTPRFEVYLATAAGGRALALALYDWNTEVSSAFHQDLAHLEVGLRNAYDRALTAGDPPDAPSWVFTPYRYFPPIYRRAKNGARYDANRQQRKNLEDALDSARRNSGASQPAPGKVIAELNFGFWRHLTARHQDRTLWVPYLHTGFRRGTTRTQVDPPVTRLHKLRNRVAHHEPLLAADLEARHIDILTVAGLLSPPLRDHLVARSRVPAVLAERPR